MPCAAHGYLLVKAMYLPTRYYGWPASRSYQSLPSPEFIIGTELYVEGVGWDGLDLRACTKARPATIPKKTTPPTTPPAIAPAFDLLLWAMGVEVLREEVMVTVEMMVEERMVAELEVVVVVAGNDDSGPPEAKISKCRPIGSSNVPALSAAAALNISPV